MKLLTKSLRSYFVYSILLVIVIVPLFYLVVQHELLHSVDKSLRTQLEDIRSNLSGIRSAADLETWSRMDKDIRLQPAPHSFPERILTRSVPARGEDDDSPVRQLEAPLLIGRQYYKLTISSSLVESDDLLGSIVVVELILLLLLLGGILWINSRISRKMWAPFYETLNTLQKYEFRNHAAVRLAPTGIAEFSELNTAAEALLNKNYQNFLAQKDFTENAAHEMQTPLAVGRSQVELLMQTTPMSEEQAGLIHALESVLERMTRSNRSLLLLSKIENEEYADAETVSLNAVAGNAVALSLPAIEERGLRLSRNFQESVSVIANKALVEILVSNLLSNAVRHNLPGGELSIATIPRGLLVQNTGGPEPLDGEKIFERFYKSGSDGRGMGLGLAIVRRVCVVNGFSVVYEFLDGRHGFRLQFPAARDHLAIRP